MRSEFKTMLEEYAKGDSDDVVGLFEIMIWVKKAFVITDDSELMKLTMELVSDALAIGYKAGVYVDGVFTLWYQQTSEYVCARISEEWVALGRLPDIGDIVWFGLPRFNYPKMEE